MIKIDVNFDFDSDEIMEETYKEAALEVAKEIYQETLAKGETRDIFEISLEGENGVKRNYTFKASQLG